MLELHSQTLHKKWKFSIKDFFSKCDQIQFPDDLHSFTEKSIMEIFIFCAIELPSHKSILETSSSQIQIKFASNLRHISRPPRDFIKNRIMQICLQNQLTVGKLFLTECWMFERITQRRKKYFKANKIS